MSCVVILMILIAFWTVVDDIACILDRHICFVNHKNRMPTKYRADDAYPHPQLVAYVTQLKKAETIYF